MSEDEFNKLRTFAQSILEGVQRLENLELQDEDIDDYMLSTIKKADENIWSLLDWIEAGRPD